MKKSYRDMPQWTFDIDEVSAGVYEVIGSDSAGHCVSAKGIDVESLLEKCRSDAVEIVGQTVQEE